eukprot:UN06168
MLGEKYSSIQHYLRTIPRGTKGILLRWTMIENINWMQSENLLDIIKRQKIFINGHIKMMALSLNIKFHEAKDLAP